MKIKSKKGQSLIETIIILPILLMLVFGVGYFGNAMTIQHNITVAARYSARKMAMESTKKPRDRAFGTFFNTVNINTSVFEKYAKEALPNLDHSRVKVEKIPLSRLTKISMAPPFLKGSFLPVVTAPNFAFVYTMTGTVTASSSNKKCPLIGDLQNMNVGVGAVFFGLIVKYRLKELDWAARFIGLSKEGITINATAMMPAELPLRLPGLGKDMGIMGINDGLFKIVTTPIRNKTIANGHCYDDLVPEGIGD